MLSVTPHSTCVKWIFAPQMRKLKLRSYDSLEVTQITERQSYRFNQAFLTPKPAAFHRAAALIFQEVFIS